MPRAERIAFVCPRFADGQTVGGAETLLRNLADRAAAAGRQVTFLTTCAVDHFTWNNSRPAGQQQIGTLDVHFFPVDEDRDLEAFLKSQHAICSDGVYTLDDERAWMSNSVNSKPLQTWLSEHGADFDRIVMGPYLFGLVFYAARLFPQKTLLVPCLHDEAFAYLRIMHELFQSVDGFMFNTEPERDLAQRLFSINEARCSVVGMGLDPFVADPQAFAQRHGLTAPYILYSGRRETLKGTPVLVHYMDAFRQRTGLDVTCVFTGRGPIDPPADLAPHVVDVGFVSEEEKHEAMAGAVCFIHPSVNESLGIVLLESWLARTPALVHARGVVLRWQCHSSGGGLWFRHYPEFEEELILLLDRNDVRQALGAAGREYVLRQYSWESVERRMFAALDAD